MSTSRRSLLKGVSLGAGSLLLSPTLQKLQAAGHPRDHFNLTGETAGIDKPGPLAELLT